jgi:AcrR family transcriptional regulator
MDRRIDVKEAEEAENDVRSRIVAAAAALIASGGRDSATTRAVAATAAVQAPTIYRLFGDKRGLLDAVAEHELASYIAGKASRMPNPDPVEEFREGWDTHVAFGLAHPDLFAIMSENRDAPAVAAGLEVLRRKVRAMASGGRLRVSESRALGLIEAACAGTVLTLLGAPAERRDGGLSAAACEAVVTAITGEASSDRRSPASQAAITLRASLDQAAALTPGERLLLAELLERIAAVE